MTSSQNPDVKIHPLADVQSRQIGKGTSVWQFSVILKDAVIGANCNINCHTFIENEVILGDNVTIKSGVYLWDGLIIEDDVFVGPCVVFTNDLRPRSKQRVEYPKTYLRQGSSIGANTTILAGVNIGRYCMTGIGSVVTRDVPDYALVYGSPARVQGWVDEQGRRLEQVDEETWQSADGFLYGKTNHGLIRK